MTHRIPRLLQAALLLAFLTNSGFAQPNSWMMEGPTRPPESQPVQKTEPTAAPEVEKSPDQEAPTAEPAKESTADTDASKTSPEPETAAESQAKATLELARKAQNPISSMISLPLQYNANFGVGPNQDTTQALNIQPVIPVSLNEDLTLVNRAIIPISYLPNSAVPPSLASGAELGLGDTNYQMYFVPTTEPGELIWGAGPTFTLPTATADKLGSGKWLAGVNAVALTMKGKWVVGALVQQQWSVAGESARPDVSIMTLQPFVNRNFKHGWFATASPIINANWEAPSGEKWTVPVGGGFGRIFTLGEQHVNVSLQGFTNVVKPTNGPDWSLRFQFSLLFP